MKTIRLFLVFLVSGMGVCFGQNSNIDNHNIYLQKESGQVNKTPWQSTTVTVYPNPNSGNFFIKVEGFDESPELQIYNMDAEVVVYEGKLSTKVNSIDLTRFAKGIYIYRVYAPVDGNMVASGKIIIE